MRLSHVTNRGVTGQFERPDADEVIIEIHNNLFSRQANWPISTTERPGVQPHTDQKCVESKKNVSSRLQNFCSDDEGRCALARAGSAPTPLP